MYLPINYLLIDTLRDIEMSCKKIAKSNTVRSIDIATVNGEFILLRFGIGLEAYLLSAIKSLFLSKNLDIYTLFVDKKIVEKGISCFVNNTGNIGIHGLTLSSKIKIDNRIIDVVIIRNPFEFHNLIRSIGNVKEWSR